MNRFDFIPKLTILIFFCSVDTEDGRVTAVLGGAPLGVPVFVDQGEDVAWPSDAASIAASLELGLWTTDPAPDQRQLPLRVLPLSAADLSVAANGRTLKISNIRVAVDPHRTAALGAVRGRHSSRFAAPRI